MANEQAQYIIELKDLVSSKLDAMNSRLDATNSKFNNVQQKAEGGLGLGKLGAIAGGLFAVSKIKEYGAEILAVGSKYESLGIQMKNLTGSAEAGSNMFAKIREDALVSPFGVDELATANTMLVSAGLSADDARQDILALSNAVAYAGKGNDELIRMSANLQQIKNIGKASSLDIKQFGYAGINIYGALAKATGKSTEEVKGMEVSYELLSKSLRIAQEEGGAFYGGLSSMADSTSVKVSNLGDISKEMFNDLFLAMKPAIDAGISGFTGLISIMRTSISWIQENTNVFKGLAIVIGLSSAAYALFNIQVGISAISLMAFNIQVFFSTIATGGLTMAMNLFGISAGIAWGIATLGLSAVVAGIIIAYNKFKGFRDFIEGLGAVFKMVWKSFKETFIDPFIKIFRGDLRGVVQGFSELFINVFSFKFLREVGKNTGKTFMEGYNESIYQGLYDGRELFTPKGIMGISLGFDEKGIKQGEDTLLGRIKGYANIKNNVNTKSKIESTENKKLSKTYENKITNITIGKLVEGLSVQVMETKEIAPKIKEMITRYLIEATNDVNIVQN
jgi:tape measure domain-containing protein